MLKNSPDEKVTHGSTRGVEYAIAEDMAGAGDVRHALHKNPLPRREGPHFTDADVRMSSPNEYLTPEVFNGPDEHATRDIVGYNYGRGFVGPASSGKGRRESDGMARDATKSAAVPRRRGSSGLGS